MKQIRYIAAKRLGKTDLDVLENAADNAGHTHIALGGDRRIVDELVDPAGLTWTPDGISEEATVQVAAVPNNAAHAAQTLAIRNQGGERHEIKLARQRQNGLTTWTAPVRAQRPPEDEAYLLIIRDEDGQIHARYLADLANVPAPLRHRLSAQDRIAAHRFEGGLVLEDPLLARILTSLRERFNVILYGPPGTGKTYLMLQVQKAFEQGVLSIGFDPEDLAVPFKEPPTVINVTERTDRVTEFVTFHPSTSYETFVLGLKPVLTDEGLDYVVEPGPFLELAEHAQQEDSASLMLIDEINRGSTAEIFGELLTVLEPDKRLDENGAPVPFRTVAVRLPYTPEDSGVVEDGRFYMPWDFYVVGSMNSVDRTVAPLDSALRRRFQIIEIPPDLNRFRVQAEKMLEAAEDEQREHLLSTARVAHNTLAALNRDIAVKRGPDFRLGHSYFWPVVDDDDPPTADARRALLIRVFADSVMPQVLEIMRERPADLALMLGGDANEGLLFRYHRDEYTGLMEGAGWLEALEYPGGLSMDEAIEVLARIAHRAGEQAWEDEQGEGQDDGDLGAADDDGEGDT